METWIYLGLLCCLWRVTKAVDGKWSEWGKWSDCSTSCGQGLTRRYRACDNPPPSLGGEWCKGNVVETKECEAKKACPVDGGWTKWTAWAKCSTTCGHGLRLRTRTCSDPVPIFGGKDCPGLDAESELCVNLKECPRAGGWSSWGSWTECSVTCGSGIKQKFRTCNNPPPAADGKPCRGKDSFAKACTANLACPVNGQWSEWSPWSPCSATCGQGQSQRTRSCDNPPAQFGGAPCNDSMSGHIEIIDCEGIIKHCAVDGSWSEWSEYGVCETLNCNNDVHKSFAFRHRSCNSPLPEHGGSMCEGRFIDGGICTQPVNCRRDGGWSMWSEWKCDGQMAKRTRSCDEPPPSHGGKDCPPGGNEEFYNLEEDKILYNTVCDLENPEYLEENEYGEENSIEEYDY